MKLSIILPVYNTEPYLVRCLDSVLPPGTGDCEIIAVNDGSTDGSGQVLERYRAAHPDLIRVIETPNGGLGHARNTGLDAASGDFVLFVDSDDWLAPGAVQEMLQILEKPDFDVAVFDYVQVDDAGTVLENVTGCSRETPFVLRDYPGFLLEPHNAVNKLWRRSLFMDTGVRFPDRLWFEDLATTPKLLLLAGVIRPLRRPWYCYYQRPGSIMQSGSAKAVRNLEMIEVADSVLRFFSERGELENYREELEYKFFYEEYLASVVRVCRIDPDNPASAKLRDDYLSRFPDYRENPRVRSRPGKYRLLDRLIRAGQWRAVRAVMALNDHVKGPH